jgi:hypothetical protein
MALRVTPAHNVARPPVWTLDCLACGRAGAVLLTQDLDTGDLVDHEGTRSHEFDCGACGSDDLCPTIAYTGAQLVAA